MLRQGGVEKRLRVVLINKSRVEQRTVTSSKGCTPSPSRRFYGTRTTGTRPVPWASEIFFRRDGTGTAFWDDGRRNNGRPRLNGMPKQHYFRRFAAAASIEASRIDRSAETGDQNGNLFP
ncbi:hypothetical protein B0H11DRAFT_1899589 [Mycena galericulata]|nr:hypothetical protein B0H11DRAFT_1899589 [Mycena galericulata]